MQQEDEIRGAATYRQAKEHCLMAAESGNVEAALRLAELLEKTGHPEEAIPWYERAAVSGDVRVVLSLAWLYESLNRPAVRACSVLHG